MNSNGAGINAAREQTLSVRVIGVSGKDWRTAIDILYQTDHALNQYPPSGQLRQLPSWLQVPPETFWPTHSTYVFFRNRLFFVFILLYCDLSFWYANRRRPGCSKSAQTSSKQKKNPPGPGKIDSHGQ